LTGSQIGAYFGYCLATADVNGDGLDDIIIGKIKKFRIKKLPSSRGLGGDNISFGFHESWPSGFLLTFTFQFPVVIYEMHACIS
jgi:hypothetical protein